MQQLDVNKSRRDEVMANYCVVKGMTEDGRYYIGLNRQSVNGKWVLVDGITVNCEKEEGESIVYEALSITLPVIENFIEVVETIANKGAVNG